MIAGGASRVVTALEALRDDVKAGDLSRFFQTGPGGYGEGDRFLGVSVPQQRSVARQFWREASLADVEELLESPFHEHRLTAILILIRQFESKRRTVAAVSLPPRAEIVQTVVDTVDRINNWDLVDTCAPRLTGPWFLDNDRSVLWEWMESGMLWRERMAIMSTFAFIRAGEFDPTITIAERFISHRHDLIHKATGWMLREIGNRDEPQLRGFLDSHVHEMPRTMLRYAIEKLPNEVRTAYLHR